jgi:hypothetical protein
MKKQKKDYTDLAIWVLVAYQVFFTLIILGIFKANGMI